jgi:hypothetical protein
MPKLSLSFCFRFITYVALFFAYVVLMHGHSFGGLDWAEQHAQRIFNSAEYLRLNGYWSSYGFSIWSTCADCELDAKNWGGNIYLSSSALFGLWPYLILNEFGGHDFLLRAGPVLDKFIIFITGIFLAEIFLILTYADGQSKTELGGKNSSSKKILIPHYFLGTLVFVWFFSSVWTYQMFRALWNEVWFLLLFMISLFFLIRERFRLGCCFAFIASSMHFISGITAAFLYFSFMFLSRIFKEDTFFRGFIPPVLYVQKNLILYCSCLALPAFLQSLLRGFYNFFVSSDGVGSPLLTRIGVSGQDPHNGGLLGALQFLGGGRMTICVTEIAEKGIVGVDMISKIAAVNCLLSIGGMILISLASIGGLVFLLKHKLATRILLFPLAMILLVLASILQQSFSAHLMGHSYLFSPLFALGLAGLAIRGSELFKAKSLSILVITPVSIAVVLVSIRVSMLIGSG